MRPIPPKLRLKMSEDLFYKSCCLDTPSCGGKIDWHHNLIFAGRQVNEDWCILPLCNHCHTNIVRVKEKVDWIMLNRANDSDIQRYSKSINYSMMKAKLNKKYGTWNLST